MASRARAYSNVPKALIGLALVLCALLSGLALCSVFDANVENPDLSSPALVGTAYANDLIAGQADASSTQENWSDFRGSETNNAVTQAVTPRTSSEADIIWGQKFSGSYVSPPIIVGDVLVVTHGRTILKLNKNTGATIARGSMSDSSLYALIPPTYADGKLFVTLSNGGLEAFDFNTLKSLWYYKDAAGGQGNCPVTYSNGYVYTGYWSGEKASRNYVCLNANTGKRVWSLPNDGGYYWAGSVVVGDYLVFGCDDGKQAGTSGTSYLRSVYKKTGKVVSQLKLKGDQRSSIAYDPDLGRVYFTAKPGYLYSAQINSSSGKLSGLKSLKLDVESAATPLVYDGRVYVGASSGSFAAGSFSIVDASTLKLLRKFDSSSGISGTVKSAPLLSTAYADGSSGRLYLYFTCNYPPGGITALSISPNSTEASVIDLFTPPESMSQYCICSVICDSDGNLYYRNDSNCLVCIGPSGTNPASYVFPDSDSSSSDDNGSSGSSGSSQESKSSGSSSSNKAGGSTKSGVNASTGNAAGTSASTKTASGSTKNASAATTSASNNSKSSESKKKQSGDSAKSDKSAASSASSKASSKQTASDSDRYTDAEAATRHLEDAEDSSLPPWTAAGIIFGIALAALAATALARFILARKDSEESDEPEQDALSDNDGPDAPANPDPTPDGNGEFRAQ